MAKLVTLMEQHLDRQPPTVVAQATTWWETVLACVKLQECGLEVHLFVKVCCYYQQSSVYVGGDHPSPPMFQQDYTTHVYVRCCTRKVSQDDRESELVYLCII